MTPEPETREDVGRGLLRTYRRTILGVTLAIWMGASLVIAPMSIFLLVGSIWGGGPEIVIAAVLAEAVHALLYVIAPRLAWGAACDRARTDAWGADLGGWVACVGPPRWPLWTLPISGAISLAMVFGGAGLLPRLAYLLAWFVWCDRVSKDVAILRWASDEEGARVLELETLDRPRYTDFEGVDVEAGEIRLHDRGRHVTWRAITPIDTLARDVKKASRQWL